MIQKFLRFIQWLVVFPLSPETAHQWKRYPACSQACVSNALEGSGCQFSSFACLCVNYRLLGQISACALPVCSEEDFDRTLSELKKDCNTTNERIKLDLCAFRTFGEEVLLANENDLGGLLVLDARAVSAAATTTSTSLTSRPATTSTTITPTSPTSPAATTSSNTAKTLEASSTSSILTAASSIASSSTSSTTIISTTKTPALISSSSSKIGSTVNPPTSTTTTTTSSSQSSSTTSLSVLTLSTPTTATPDATFTPTATSFPLPSIVPCTDPRWQLSPENWLSLNVDSHLQQTSSEWGPGIGSFLEFVANFTGVQGLHCGIGTASTCTLPTCLQLQEAGAEPWQYLVAVAVIQMNTLINVLHDGISAGKEDLALVIIAMANDFFEWKNPQTTTKNALPWIAAMLTSVLSFIPLLFELDSILAPISSGAGQTAAAFAAGGLQTLAANANPDTFLLSNMETLGIFVKDISTNATSALETWSKTLFAGEQDASGKTIIDYMANGRFAFIYDIEVPDVETYFFQSVVSDVVNDQLVSNKSNSKTFVMCGDGTVPCSEESYFSENGKSCCLYRFANNNTYIAPPEVTALKNSKYDYINSSSVVASSLRSYLAQGLDYNQSDTNAFINSSLSSDLRDQSFIQGPSAAGIWTLPVCDVGSHTDWVADYSALMMPCCCGSSCSETTEFFHKAHLAGNSKVNSLCASQYKPFAAVSSGRTLELSPFGLIVAFLVMLMVG
ncbi:uncharacterized protein PAC_18598 [Phialocephala subalpina]|uniref:CFEM domain-containing protein n=1 Tax=Phialocephala subalpina TaxID=576137 RepID=A0A1L7XUJ8_9HELO|nr:uncharacterized protein PAC_18598 [Phialocephala subalpina]